VLVGNKSLFSDLLQREQFESGFFKPCSLFGCFRNVITTEFPNIKWFDAWAKGHVTSDWRIVVHRFVSLRSSFIHKNCELLKKHSCFLKKWIKAMVNHSLLTHLSNKRHSLNVRRNMYIQPVLVSKLSCDLLALAGNKPSEQTFLSGSCAISEREMLVFFLARNSRFVTRAQTDSALKQGRGNSRNQGYPSDCFLFRRSLIVSYFLKRIVTPNFRDMRNSMP